MSISTEHAEMQIDPNLSQNRQLILKHLVKFRVGFKSKPDTTTLLKQSRDCTYKTNKTENLVYFSNTLKKTYKSCYN